jgi:hypothetical protein
MAVSQYVSGGGHVTWPWECGNPGCGASGSSIFEMESRAKYARHRRQCPHRKRRGGTGGGAR